MAASVLSVQPQVAQDHAPGGTLISKNPVTTTRWREALMENSSRVRLQRTPSMEMNRCARRSPKRRGQQMRFKSSEEGRTAGRVRPLELRAGGPGCEFGDRLRDDRRREQESRDIGNRRRARHRAERAEFDMGVAVRMTSGVAGRVGAGLGQKARVTYFQRERAVARRHETGGYHRVPQQRNE